MAQPTARLSRCASWSAPRSKQRRGEVTAQDILRFHDYGHASDVAFLVLLPQSGSFRTMEIRGGTTMLAQGRDGLGETAYERHQPEQTLLYQLVEAHYPTLVDQLAHQGKSLPDHVHREY